MSNIFEGAVTPNVLVGFTQLKRFTGSPGSGKSTEARMFAREKSPSYKEIFIIDRDYATEVWGKK